MANIYSEGRPPKDGKRVEVYMNEKLYYRLEAFVKYEKEHRERFDDFPSRTHIIEKAVDWYLDYAEEEREKKIKAEIEKQRKFRQEIEEMLK